MIGHPSPYVRDGGLDELDSAQHKGNSLNGLRWDKKVLRGGLRFDLENFNIMVLLDVLILRNVSIRKQIKLNGVYMGGIDERA